MPPILGGKSFVTSSPVTAASRLDATRSPTVGHGGEARRSRDARSRRAAARTRLPASTADGERARVARRRTAMPPRTMPDAPLAKSKNDENVPTTDAALGVGDAASASSSSAGYSNDIPTANTTVPTTSPTALGHAAMTARPTAVAPMAMRAGRASARGGRAARRRRCAPTRIDDAVDEEEQPDVVDADLGHVERQERR